jgi:hypothetical protein
MAASRLRNKIKYLFWLSGSFVVYNNKIVTSSVNKLSFVTLTLSAAQFHSDIYIKKYMLNQLIIELRILYKDFNYIWRCEKQKNGNIHFHLLIDIFIPWHRIREIWNRIQTKEGYIQKYHDKFKWFSFNDYLTIIPNYDKTKINEYKQAYAYGLKSNWYNPNSIDVHSLKHINNTFAYLSKYLSKNRSKSEIKAYNLQTNQKIQGRTYYCSGSISALKPYAGNLSNLSLSECDALLELVPNYFLEKDFFAVICLPIEKIFNLGFKYLYLLFITNFNYLQL